MPYQVLPIDDYAYHHLKSTVLVAEVVGSNPTRPTCYKATAHLVITIFIGLVYPLHNPTEEAKGKNNCRKET
jgi:hypothetical protein